jgi:hypothetical protein
MGICTRFRRGRSFEFVGRNKKHAAGFKSYCKFIGYRDLDHDLNSVGYIHRVALI